MRSVLLAALLIGSTSQIFAQSAAPTTPGMREGIQVHGDWVIEVRNPDGRLAERREFKNALLSQGGSVLSQFMGRQLSPGRWIVGLADRIPGAPDPCDGFAGSPSACGIYEVIAAGGVLTGFAPASANLQLSAAPGALRLAGSVTATAAATINEVWTFVGTCAAAIAPATSCQGTAAGSTFPFSTTNAFPPVNVVAGQIIQVVVTFSFS